MQRLSQAARRNSDLGSPLHNPFTRLREEAGLEFYPGDLVIIAAADGTGKSVLAMLLALLTDETTLYVSPDTSATTTVVRTIQHLFRVDGKTARDMYVNEDPRVMAALNKDDKVRWNFRRVVDTASVAYMANAYAEVKGTYPGFITVDGLSSLVSLEESSAALSNARGEMVQQLNMLAASTKSCVIVPTHVKGGEGGKNLSNVQKLDKGQVLDNVTKLAATVITGHRDSETNDIGLCVVKYRTGEASPTASKPYYLETDLRVMSIKA